MEKWIKILSAGHKKTVDGQERMHSNHDLQLLAGHYNDGGHEAPIVIGEPSDTKPAWGWIEQLKVVGRDLLAKAHQVDPKFAEMLDNGKLKTRRVVFYNNGLLKTIMYCGVAPPLPIKTDSSFGEDNNCYECYVISDGAKMPDYLNWVEENVNDLQLKSSWIKAGVHTFMETLDLEDSPQFSGNASSSRLEWFKEFALSCSAFIETAEEERLGREIASFVADYCS